MTDERLQQIERLVEDAGRCFDPATGLFEPLDGAAEEEEVDTSLDPQSFLGLLGMSEDECAEYVQRKLHDYDESFRKS
jgi:hypothetical protein